MPPPRLTKLFDPGDGFGPFRTLHEVTDATVARRDGQWWMCVAGQPSNRHSIELFSATLPRDAPLAANGWTLAANPANPAEVAVLAGHDRSRAWDLRGGRHCPSYVRGWDPHRGAWVERIYYAGGAEQPWGPYTIGFLEWDGETWVDQGAPVLVARDGWERGSVYEPNVVYADGRWRLWYVAGSNADDYLVQAVVESEDGRTEWSTPQIFAMAEERMFDFHPLEHAGRWEAVFSRVWIRGGTAPPETGLWWCWSSTPSLRRADWSTPVHILPAAASGWYAGPWKPSPQYGENGRLFVFFDGMYGTGDGSAFPFAFTLGCLEIDKPWP